MKKTIIITQFVDAPIDIVFDTFTNHETYLSVFGVTKSTALKLGEDNQSNTVGAIRKVKIGPLFIKEEVVGFERPFVWKYKFSDWFFPFIHLSGSMCFQKEENGTLVTWASSIEEKTLLSTLILPFSSLVNKNILKFVAKQIALITQNKTGIKVYQNSTINYT